MTDLLKNWLNKEIVLSKNINDISYDFKNGYLFAELLYKTKQIPNLTLFKNTNNNKDIISNFCYLQKNFLDIGIVLDEKSRNDIMNASPYASLIYLFKIKQILSRKNIDLEQLKLKESTTIQNLYNKLIFKNDNEKYFHIWQVKHGIKNKRSLKKSNSTLLPTFEKSTEDILNEKYDIKGTFYKELKSKYSHLDFTEEDIRIIMDEMKKNEKKLLNFKYSINTIENNRKLSLKKNHEEIKKIWEREYSKMENFKNVKLKESWMPAVKYKLVLHNYFKTSSKKNMLMSSKFDDNLKFLIGENDQQRQSVNSEIIMFNMRKKLDENLKNKRDKEKRERKRLKEEQELIEISTRRNKIDMKAETKKYLNDIKSEANIFKKIDINQKPFMKFNNDDNEPMIKERRSRNVNINKDPTESTNFQKIIEEQKQTRLDEQNNEKLGQTKFSSFSKLSENDYGLGLFNEYKNLHNIDIRIHDRIKLFRTLIPTFQNNQKLYQDANISKMESNLNNTNVNNSLMRIDNSYNIFDKSTTLNNSSEFNKNFYLEEVNKLDYELVKKEYEYKLDKSNRKKKLISPIVSQLIDLTEYIWDYQETKKIDLIENPKWDELMIKFIGNRKINEIEECVIKKEEDEENGNYLIDYGDKLTNEDDKKKLDYVNYINSFNDLIIPNEIRGKKLSYPELYKEFYIKRNNQDVDIKDYEPNLVESENLYLPMNSKIKNYKFSDIMETIIENKYSDALNKKLDSYNIINKYEKKGKYYYLPIKIVLNGYPLSGKKTQCHLIKEKYKGIKIYNPQKMLRNKYREYLEIKAAKEESENADQQKQKPKSKKDEKSLEDRIKEFKPILKIIKPYIEFLDKISKLKEKEEKRKEKEERKKVRERTRTKLKTKIKKTGKDDEENKKDEVIDKNQDNTSQNNSSFGGTYMTEYQNEKEEILSNVYLKLILNQLEKDFPTEKKEKLKLMKNINEKYRDYLNLKEKIKDLNIKINEEKSKNIEETTQQKSKNKKENKVLVGLNKELENTKKNLETTKNSLYIGFIFVNFPKNLKEAEKIENYFTGYVSELEKGLSESEKKLYNYGDIIDINIKRKTGIDYYSFFDLFIEFKVTSEEMNRRYKGAKYDSLTAVIYHTKDNPPPQDDKKIESRLTPGIPYMSKEEVYLEKTNYEVNIKSLERLYKAMTNGFGKVYMSIDQMDLSNLKNINNNLENAITNIIFNNYYNNVETIFNNINENNTNKNIENKEKIKEKSPNDNQGKMESSNLELNKTTDNIKNSLTLSEEILKELDEFHSCYQSNLKNLNHFILCQKENVISYLNSIQNIFISFLNRKTNKLEVADIFIQKFNDIIENHPKFNDDKLIIDELSENIKDVSKSIWINIQNKKLKDIKYLEDLKNSGKKEKECDIFFEYISSIFELEVEKYLLCNEIIIKHYLSKFGLLNNIYISFDNNKKATDNKKYLFKVNHKEFIYRNIDIHKKRTEMKNKENKVEEEKKDTNEENIDENNETRERNRNKKIYQNVEDKINTLFMNSLKIIIRQDDLSNDFIEKIKNYIKREKDKYISRNISTKLVGSESNKKKLNASLSSRSVSKKVVLKKTNSIEVQNDISLNYEELKNQIIKEKRKLKYRLIFLKYYSLRYIKIIKDCYNETYNTLDDLIIMSVKFQNDTLNEFTKYLKKSLNYFNKKINSNDFEFDTFDIFYRYKKDIANLYRKYNQNFIYNADGIKLDSEKREIKNKDYITEEEMSYTQLFEYNLKDLMSIYHYIKLYGVDTCNFFVKYNIVNEILIKHYFNNKKYGIYENQKSEDEFDRIILGETINEENNGICNKILFASNINYINFLDNFAEFNNNFININELFTSLLILGSELINPDKFFDIIKEYLPINKREEKNIFLTKEEFMELPMWFENDEYLNSIKDISEKKKYSDINEETNINLNQPEHKENIQIAQPFKKDAVKESIFEIYAENNLLELNKIIVLLNKLNNIYLTKNNINNVEESEKNSLKKIKDSNYNKMDTSNEESNKIELSNSKLLNIESKMSSSLQSGNKNRISDSQKNKNFNNIFNILFN